MPDIVITEFLEPAALDQIPRDLEVVWDPTLWSKRAELERLLVGLPALIVRNRTTVDAALLDLGTKLRVVGRLGVGLDNIDVAHCDRRGIEVVSARGGNATSVAEYVIAMAMTLLRGPAYLGSDRLVAGEWPREAFGRGGELAGKTLGIIGLGSIGMTTARKARALDMRVIANDPYLADTHEGWRIAEPVPLDRLLSEADVITIHSPLTDETRGLIAARQMQAMRKGAILINTSRGGVVDHSALAAALASGHLGGAAIDVFTEEPIRPQDGQQFAGVPNIILTPHISGVTAEANRRVSMMTVEGVLRVLSKAR